MSLEREGSVCRIEVNEEEEEASVGRIANKERSRLSNTEWTWVVREEEDVCRPQLTKRIRESDRRERKEELVCRVEEKKSP